MHQTVHLRSLLAGALLVVTLSGVTMAQNEPAKGYRPADTEQLPAPAREALKKLAVEAPATTSELAPAPRLIFRTNKGPITLELNSKAAPLHVRSFLSLAGKGFFDGTRFHRWADLTGEGGNIIQGGDPLSKSDTTREFSGIGGPGYQIPLEISALKHTELVLSMARSSDPDSAGSQFYITQAPVHFLDNNYTVFGKVVAGKEAAKALRQNDVLEKAELVPEAETAKEAPAKAPAKEAPKTR